MKIYQFDTTLFGKLEVPVADGLLEDYNVMLDGKEISLNLYIMEDFLTEDNKQIVSNLLRYIPQMYQKGKQTILKQKGSNEVICYFIEWHLEQLDDIIEIFGVDTTADITPEQFIEKLEPRTIRIGSNSDDQIDCVFDFSLPEEYSDDLLVVYFDDAYKIIDISHES